MRPSRSATCRAMDAAMRMGWLVSMPAVRAKSVPGCRAGPGKRSRRGITRFSEPATRRAKSAAACTSHPKRAVSPWRVRRHPGAIDRDRPDPDHPRPRAQRQHVTEQPSQRILMLEPKPIDRHMIRHKVRRDHPIRRLLSISHHSATEPRVTRSCMTCSSRRGTCAALARPLSHGDKAHTDRPWSPLDLTDTNAGWGLESRRMCRDTSVSGSPEPPVGKGSLHEASTSRLCTAVSHRKSLEYCSLTDA